MSKLFLIRHSGIRQIDEAEVRATMSQEDLELTREEINIESIQFVDDVGVGQWQGQDGFHHSIAQEIKGKVDETEDSRILYFGLAEIPHMISFGSHFGDERSVEIYDFDRGQGQWIWPEDSQTVEIIADGIPTAPAVTAAGQVVIKISISAQISDESVLAHVGQETLADVTIRPKDETPNIGLVRSKQDLEAIRLKIREAIGAIEAYRPGVSTIHLFVAAPASVCFALGQEFKRRNAPPVQTYKYSAGQYLQALLLDESSFDSEASALSSEEIASAKSARSDVWAETLKQVVNYAKQLREDHDSKIWYERLQPREILGEVAPFPSLRPLAKIDCDNHSIDPVPYEGEYGFDVEKQTWKLSDGLVVGFQKAVGENEKELANTIRLFFFHEFCHEFHGLTKLTATEVGKFQNCLEYIDYTADTFALLHQLDWTRIHDRETVDNDSKKKSFLASQIELILRSFWAFDPNPPVNTWQVRRLRRYMNWYWRFVQISRAKTLKQALMLFRKQPHVELAGLKQFARGRRFFNRIDKFDPTVQLELAIVLENDRLFRIPETPSASLTNLLEAFAHGKHDEILNYFRTVFEGANSNDEALPTIE